MREQVLYLEDRKPIPIKCSKCGDDLSRMTVYQIVIHADRHAKEAKRKQQEEEIEILGDPMKDLIL